MSTNIRLGFALLIGAGLVGCGSGGSNGSDSAGCAERAADAGNAAEAAASADHPTGGIEVGFEAPVPLVDAGADVAAAPLDGAVAADGPLTAPDAVAVAGPDAADAAGGPDAVDTDTPTPDLAPATLGELSPPQLEAALANKDFLLIDVHYPNAGSIPGTDARIAYNDVLALVAFIGSDLNRKVVLTCLMGGMSKQAGNALVALGYRNISELTGGLTAWTNAGYTVVHLDGGM